MKLSKSKFNQIIMEEYVTVKREAFRDSPEDKEKDDLLGLYSDVWKYKHGTRPRGKMQWMFDNMTADAMNAVDTDLMRESDPSMPISRPNRNTKVTFGRGS